MLFEKIVERYFPDHADYEESPDGRTVSFKMEDSDLQDDPEFEPKLRELAHILQPEIITHKIHKRDNGGCGDPECCGYNYVYSDVHINCVGVRFSEEDSENLVVDITKLAETGP